MAESDVVSPDVEGLSDYARAAFGSPAPLPPKTSEPTCYFLVEYPEGDAPIVHRYATPAAVARHLGRLDGSDNFVCVFYGELMPFSRGPGRYLLLPGGAEALLAPPGGRHKPRRVDASLLNFKPQEDGFLGEESPTPPGREPPQDMPEDDDDEEEELPAAVLPVDDDDA